MPTWTDDEGRLRLRADDKHQFLCNVPLEFLDPWTSYDSWSAELAIRLITIGYNLDIQRCWDEAIDYPYGSTGKDSAWAYVDVYERGMSIAQSSIAAGLLKNPDTPANWLAWAKCKGYDVAHLKHPQTSPATNTATPEPVATNASVAAQWSVVQPKRFHSYGKPLYDFLKTAQAAGLPKPSAREVLDKWKETKPHDVSEVTDNGLKYYDVRGNTKPADLDAIRKSIGRMTRCA